MLYAWFSRWRSICKRKRKRLGVGGQVKLCRLRDVKLKWGRTIEFEGAIYYRVLPSLPPSLVLLLAPSLFHLLLFEHIEGRRATLNLFHSPLACPPPPQPFPTQAGRRVESLSTFNGRATFFTPPGGGSGRKGSALINQSTSQSKALHLM